MARSQKLAADPSAMEVSTELSGRSGTAGAGTWWNGNHLQEGQKTGGNSRRSQSEQEKDGPDGVGAVPTH